MSEDGRLVAPSEPPMDRLIGRTIDGRYYVESVMGEGGMGLVYKAKHTALNKPLALKVLRDEVSKNEEVIARFRQEAQSASAIGNQHIIDISDFGNLPGGSTYFVMEYLDGRDLTAAITEESPMAPERVLRIARQLAKALGAAHDIGIVHRDLKPDNIFLINRGGDSDFVKILDFGIAKVGTQTQKLTKAGDIFGTPHYMSPEQCAGNEIDHRTDIYALGVIFYEMVTGKVPFDAETLMGVLTKQMYEAPKPLHELETGTSASAELEAVILKCLAKEPDSRYANMHQLLEDLERLQRGEQPIAVDEAVERHSLTGEAARDRLTGKHAVGAAGGFLPQKSKKPLYIGLGLLALLVIGAVAALSGGSSTEEETAIAQQKEAEEAELEAARKRAEEAQLAAEKARAEAEAAKAKSAKLPAGADAPKTAKPKITNYDTTPTGAEVYLDGALLGQTPLDVERPRRGERLELTFKLDGYKDETVRLIARTQAKVHVKLEKDRSSSRRRRASRTSAKSQPTTETKTVKRNRRKDEIADPWAN